MELTFERDTIVCYETAVEVTLCQEETLESIVPDACPDILRIVDVCGQAVLGGGQAREGMAAVSGTVQAGILYQPEGAAGLRRMEVELPFSCQAEAPGLTEEGKVLACPRLRSAEARALNPRKVLLRVDLAVDITACQPVERAVCRGVQGEEDQGLCQKQWDGEDWLLTAVEKRPFPFSETIRLQTGQGEVPRVLALRAEPSCGESKLIGNRLICKGAVEIHMLLQEPGGGMNAARESLPFSQVLEVPAAGENGDCQVEVAVTALNWDVNPGDDGELEVELVLEAQAMVRAPRPVTLLQDLYSTAWEVETEREKQVFCRLEEQSIRPQAAREMVETGEMVRGVVDARLALGQVTRAREGGQAVLTAEGWITVLYLDENGTVQCARRTVPVTCRLDCPEGSRCECRCRSAGEIFAAPMAGGVEVRFTLEFHCRTTSRQTVPAVRGARLTEPRGGETGPRPSIVLRRAGPGEEAWDIAKAYGTTVERILKANALEEETLPEGQILLIPGVRT